jgi:hypothetical protein
MAAAPMLGGSNRVTPIILIAALVDQRSDRANYVADLLLGHNFAVAG